MTVSPPRRVAVLTHVGRPAAIAAAARLVQGLSAAGITALVPPADVPALSDVLDRQGAAARPSELGEDLGHPGCELVVVLGGDGTILRGAEWALAVDTPLLGVNLGHVGFLAEAESTELNAIVEHIVHQTYTVEERNTILVDVYDPDGRQVWHSFAVNEVSIEKAARERMLEVMVEVDGRPLSQWGCDGVLVATPTGSTAYAFSAGGPVIWPGVNAVLLLPISAHALFSRPLVLGPQSRVEVELLETGSTVEGVVWCDGRRSTTVHAGSRIAVRHGVHRLRLARLSPAPFTDRLVRKFGLRVEGWRGQPAFEVTETDGVRPGSP